MSVTGIVLAAGGSERLGRPKQTLPLGETTVLGRTVREAERSALDAVVVVLGGAAEDVLHSLSLERASLAYNDAYSEGCARSILAGLDAAGEATDAVVLLPGDMPGVGPAVIAGVLDAWEKYQPWGMIASYRGDLGHPILFSTAAFEELRSLHGDGGVWKIVAREPEERIRRVDFDRPKPRDIDTWDDYLAVCYELGCVPAESAVIEAGPDRSASQPYE